MKLLGNILWFIMGGFFTALGWFLIGLILYITIIGIPLGRQFMKLAGLSLFPFGKEAITDFNKHPILNILWLVFIGWSMVLGSVAFGVMLCATIIGIPFGLQHFKLAIISIAPFGSKVIEAK